MPKKTFTPTADWFDPDCDNVPVPLPPGGNLEDESGYACTGGGEGRNKWACARVRERSRLWDQSVPRYPEQKAVLVLLSASTPVGRPRRVALSQHRGMDIARRQQRRRGTLSGPTGPISGALADLRSAKCVMTRGRL